MKSGLIGAIAALGMLAAANVQAAAVVSPEITLSFTADNVANSYWVLDGANEIIAGMVLSTSSSGAGGRPNPNEDWRQVDERTESLSPGDYKIVFGVTNNNDRYPAGFLAEIMGPITGSSLVTNSTDWTASVAEFAAVSASRSVGDDLSALLPAGAPMVVEAANADGGIWPEISEIDGSAQWIWASSADVAGQSAWIATEITVVPIPAAGVLFLSAISGLLLLGRRRSRGEVGLAS